MITRRAHSGVNPGRGRSSRRSSLALMLQAVPGVVLMGLGWGWRDLRAFLQDPARAGLLLVLLAAAAIASAMNLNLHPLRRGTAAAPRQTLQLAILAMLSLFLLWFLPFADRRSIWTMHAELWRYVGLALCAAGAAIRIAALRSLNEFFSAYVTLQPNHRLVQSGIYRSIRHPLYLSLLLAPVGVALVFKSWLALPIQLLAVIFVAERIGQEESLLAARFGDEWKNYRARTWKLIPRLI